MSGVVTASPPAMAPATAVTGRRPRFASLDVFRGITVFSMILVNSPGPGAPPFATLQHAEWFGLTFADLVFPSFLFAIGIAMGFASRRDLPAGPYLRSAATRAGLIFLLGLLLAWFPFVARDADGHWQARLLADLRIPGVLQRIALCYLVAALAVRWLRPRAVLLLALGLVAAHGLILVGASPPGLAFDRDGNAGTSLDVWLFGVDHLYRQDGGLFDPEGMLGTLSSTANVLAGFLAGRLLQDRGLAGATRRLAPAGVALVAAAVLLHPWLPLSKKLWTGSFVAVTVGIDLLLLALLVWAIELRGWRAGVRFFQIPGRNPLALYLFSEMFIMLLGLVRVSPRAGLYEVAGGLLQRVVPGPVGSLACALGFTMICWGVGWIMDRRGLILRL